MLCVHRGVERAPVVPALGDRRAGQAAVVADAAGTGRVGIVAVAHQSLIGRVMFSPTAAMAASLKSIRAWFHFSQRSYSMLGLCGFVVASISVGVT